MEVKGPVSCAIEWRIAPTFGCAPSPTFLPERWNETTGAVPIVIGKREIIDLLVTQK